MKNFRQITSQKHINSLMTTFITVLKLEIADGVECVERKPVYITLKDHKENFNINTKCRLINPAKSELEKFVKIIVDNISKIVREKLHCNQWRNTSVVIDWFQNIADKRNFIFIQFVIE